MNVAIFCSAQNLPEIYSKPTRELAHLLVGGGHTIVYGGSDAGLMKILADAVTHEGGKLIGVSVEFLKHVARKNIDEMIVARDIGERKALMLKRSDAVIVLAGGLGTLSEASEVIDLKKLGIHRKKIIILNTENFYDGLLTQLTNMKQNGFIAPSLNELFSVAQTPAEVMVCLSE